MRTVYFTSVGRLPPKGTCLSAANGESWPEFGDIDLFEHMQEDKRGMDIHPHSEISILGQVASEIIHVVVALYDRNNTSAFLAAIAGSSIPDGFRIKVYLANNDPRRSDSLKFNARLHSSSYVSFNVEDMSRNLHGFSRFLLVRSLLRRDKAMNYVIFLDDDQYLLRNSLFTLWSQKVPRSIVSWYGKCWNAKVRSLSYWQPKHGMSAVLTKSKHPRFWHYAGTGFSVIDTRIFQDERIFDIPHDYMFVEDLWLSYVLGLNNWSLRRAFVDLDIDSARNKMGQWSSMHELKETMFQHLVRCRHPLKLASPC